MAKSRKQTSYCLLGKRLNPLNRAKNLTHLPPKAEFERKIREILVEAQERLERHKRLKSGISRHHDYFFEPKDDEEE